MAADVLKAKQAIAALRAEMVLTNPEFNESHIDDLCDTFEWLLASRNELMRAMALLSEHANKNGPPGSQVLSTVDERGFLQPVKVEPHDV